MVSTPYFFELANKTMEITCPSLLAENETVENTCHVVLFLL